MIHLTETIYVCGCGQREEYRATNNVPTAAHYCAQCFEALPEEERAACVRVGLKPLIVPE